ncbi:hypothetical protein Leryth_016866 [Lithospermum erythrorhizon]|nr:hypothetical protein Leryth_016866 [Lithospermum erythrorhizon]
MRLQGLPAKLLNKDRLFGGVYASGNKLRFDLESLKIATKFTGSAFVGNDCLCGSPLPACKA